MEQLTKDKEYFNTLLNLTDSTQKSLRLITDSLRALGLAVEDMQEKSEWNYYLGIQEVVNTMLGNAEYLRTLLEDEKELILEDSKDVE